MNPHPLFQPYRLKSLALKNWIVMAPMTRSFSPDGVPTSSVAMPAGEVFGFLGRNGAGKSTAIKMLVTLLPPTYAEAKVAGNFIFTLPVAVRRTIGYVPQGVSVDELLTAYENLLIFARRYDFPRAQRKQCIHESLIL